MGSVVNLFLFRLFESPWDYLSWVLLVAFAVCVHEYAHARVALWRGDPTAADQGHLTLDPTVQMGWPSIITLLFFGIAWGAVPINPARLRKTDQIAVALAGPLANFALSILFAGVGAGLLRTGVVERVEGAPWLAVTAARANATLMVFNLLPLPSLDGWQALCACVPALANLERAQGALIQWWVLMLLFFTPLFSWVWSGGDFIASWVLFGWMNLLH